MKEKQIEYVVNLVSDNGDGFVLQIWRGSDITDFQVCTDLLAKGCMLIIEIEYN